MYDHALVVIIPRSRCQRTVSCLYARLIACEWTVRPKTRSPGIASNEERFIVASSGDKALFAGGQSERSPALRTHPLSARYRVTLAPVFALPCRPRSASIGQSFCDVAARTRSSELTLSSSDYDEFCCTPGYALFHRPIHKLDTILNEGLPPLLVVRQVCRPD